MPSMLPYIGIWFGCGIGIALILGRAIRSSDEQQILQEVLLEHREDCEEESGAQVDDFFVAVDDAKTETLCEELESVFALEAREPVR